MLYYGKKGIPEEKACLKAINDYKNDKLDFYVDTNIDLSNLIEEANKIYDLDL